MANSIAIFTDCAHLASDMLSFVMAMYALKVSLREASKELTFGWHRAEIIGTLASMMFLVTITVWLLIAAVQRLIKPEAVDGLKMLITAGVSLMFNLVQIKILH
jgi:zinc transporter 2